MAFVCGDLIFIDELYTPDSSRFWPTSAFRVRPYREDT
ncbi:MAG: hypothetical protein KAQ71_10280 [Desulfobulbaceae bacterium]|nr:hypothetical protein [Desulfobulbaceae bacterium]